MGKERGGGKESQKEEESPKFNKNFPFTSFCPPSFFLSEVSLSLSLSLSLVLYPNA